MKFSSLIFILIFSFSQVFGQTKIFVKFKEHVTASEIKHQLKSIISKSSLSKTTNPVKEIYSTETYYEKFGHLNKLLDKITIITIPKDTDVNQFIENLSNNNDIAYIQKSTIYKIDNFNTNDSLYNEQWGLQSVHAPEAWQLISNDTTKVLLAIIDTGIDYEHPDLKNILFVNKGETGTDRSGNDKRTNGIDDDGNGFIDDYRGWDFVNKLDVFPGKLQDDFTNWDNDPMDENKHGTVVSGIIGAEHNSIGIAGVSPNVKILNLRAFDKNGEGEEDDVASAIIYAVKMGAKIINMSFGDRIYSEVLKDVIDYAHSQNVILVGSAGNSASDLPHYPSGFNEVISVGAIQEDEILAGFSNYGSTIDLVAPGSQIITTTLDNRYNKFSGTSVATPFVSAATAMLVSQNINYTNDEIKQILKSTAQDLGKSGWDIKYGAGKLNILKSLQLNVPSEIKINEPEQDYFVQNDLLQINISVLSPYFKNFDLSYGIGYNPKEWEKLITDKENIQLLKENVYSLNTSNLTDTVFTIRLLVNNVNGTTSEERVNFHIDRTKPEIEFASIIPAILNDSKTFSASIASDDISIAQLFFRNTNQVTNFDSIYLDGITTDLKFNRNNHFGIIQPKKLDENTEYEFYFKVTNRAGLETIYKSENGTNFILENEFSKYFNVANKKNYKLPLGRIYHAPVSFDTTNTKYILINEKETSSDISIFKKGSADFTKITSLEKRIPVSIGDFNKDGKTDILSLFVKKGYIETQTETNSLNFVNGYKDTTGSFWPSYAGDIDNDNKTEIIVFSSDTSITIWEVQQGSNFNLTKETTLFNFAKQTSADIGNSIFRNNQILVDDFNDNGKNEIVTIDNFGRLITYNILGANLYSNGIIKEHYYPVESKNIIAKGDFDGDGTKEVAVFMEFEDDIFITPVKYCTVLSIKNLSSDPLFNSMFLDVSSSFVSAYEKKYNSIEFVDLNNDNKKELVISSFPNLYIFNYVNNSKPNLLFYKTDVNTQSILVGDLDNNGYNEISIPNISLEETDFYDFNSFLFSHPIIEEYYSIDSTHNYIKWQNDNKAVKIFYGTDSNNLLQTDTTSNNTYITNSLPNSITYYSLAFYNKETGELLSDKSKVISIYTHAPAKIKSVNVFTPKDIEILFNKRINTKELLLRNFRIDTDIIPNSIQPSSQYSIMLHFSNNLEIGTHLVNIKSLRDYYNSPIADTTLQFSVSHNIAEEKSLYISSYKIINNNKLNIIFNINIDTLTSLNISNYTITPNNIVSNISFYNNSKNTLQITTKKPFGSIGKEYTLTIKNLVSSKETGNIPLKENVGNQIVLVTSAENIDNVYVYPNPVNITEFGQVTFANLTNNVEIYIYQLDGKFITKLIEEDSNGGITWNLMDNTNKQISSGIYIYRIIAYNQTGEVTQEKIGKFAVTR